MTFEEIYEELLNHHYIVEQTDENPIDFPDDEEEPRSGEQRPLKPIQVLKLKWKEENPLLSDIEINEAINAFNARKNTLRPINLPPRPGDMPEIVALNFRYPDFNVTNISSLKDIQSYTWEQLRFLLDRFNATEAAEQINYSLVGETFEDKMANALEKWKNLPSKIISENNLIVHRIESKEQSMALGHLQHLVVGKWNSEHPDSWNMWCVTYRPEQHNTNLYSNYRDRRSFYFILDLNRKDDKTENGVKYFVSVIQPIKSGHHEGPYVITDAKNHYQNEATQVSWNEILQIWPGLRGKENLFVYFPTTRQESVAINLDQINFDNPRSPNFFANIPTSRQEEYIDAGRLIHDPRIFLALPYRLQELYVKKTNIDNYKTRFLGRQNSSDPFEMLRSLRKQDLKTLHEDILIRQLGFIEGVNRIKTSIIENRYSAFAYDNENNYLFRDKSNPTIFGVLNLVTYTWIKNVEYKLARHRLLLNTSEVNIPVNERIYKLLIFEHETNEKFGWLFKKENPKQGVFLDSDEKINETLRNYKQI